MKNIEFEFLNGKTSYILHVKNAIPKEVCDGLVNECLKYYDKVFRPGPTMGGVNPFMKNSMDFSFSRYALSETDIPLEPFGSYEDTIAEISLACVSHYVNEFSELWNWPGLRDTGFRLQRYLKNFGYYRQHVDNNPWGPVASENRVLASVIYLNTVGVGGETYFPEHDVCVPAVAGNIAIFPASWTHPHQGNVPIGNDKWIISSFYLCDKEVSNSDTEQSEVQEPIEA